MAADFAVERQHGAEDFPEGREIVLRDPLAEFEELRVKDGLGVEDREQRFRFDGRGLIVQAQDDAGELLIAKRNQHPRADDGNAFTDCIGEGAIERDRYGDITKSGHGFFFGEYQNRF